MRHVSPLDHQVHFVSSPLHSMAHVPVAWFECYIVLSRGPGSCMKLVPVPSNLVDLV